MSYELWIISYGFKKFDMGEMRKSGEVDRDYEF